MIDRWLHGLGESISRAFPCTPICVALMGSFAHERTDDSDVDISVIFADREYDRHEQEIVGTTTRLADELGVGSPHPIKIWPAKADFFRIGLPDPQFVLANTPATIKDLDGWGGLALTTFQRYFLATRKILWGEDCFREVAGPLPEWDAFELFLISTRILASVFCRGPSSRSPREARALVAKAVLRAAYAHHILETRTPLSSYAAIGEAASASLSGKWAGLVKTAVSVKLGHTADGISLDEAVDFLLAVEQTLRSAPRLHVVGGASWSRPGDRFAFDILASTERRQRRWIFRGCLPSDNFVHALYFLRTMPLVCQALIQGSPPPAVWEFFAPEIIGQLLAAGLGGRVGTFLVTSRGDYYPIRWDGALACALQPIVERLLGGNWPIPTRHIPPEAQPAEFRALSCISMYLSHLADQKGEEASKWFQRGLSYGRSSWARAMEVWPAWALELNPTNAWAHNVVASCYLEAGLPTEAAAHIRKAVALEPKYVANQEAVVNHFRQEGLSNQADACLDAARRISEANAAVLLRLVGQVAATSQLKPAIETCEFVLSNGPKHGEVKSLLIDVYKQAGLAARLANDQDEAERIYRRLLELAPADKTLFNNRAVMHAHFGRIRDAIRDYQHALELDPQYELPYVGWGWLLENEKQIGEAIRVYEKAIAQGVRTAKILANLGNCHLQEGDYDQARAQFEEALRVDPAHANAMNGLGIIALNTYRITGSRTLLGDAARHFQAACATDPGFEGAKANLVKCMMLLRDGLGITGLGVRQDSSGERAETCQHLYETTKAQAAILRVSGTIRAYCQCLLAFLRSVHSLATSQYEDYRNEFLLDMTGFLAETRHAEGSKAEWREVLSELVQEADLDQTVLSTLRFLHCIVFEQYDAARGMAPSLPFGYALAAGLLPEPVE